MCNSLREHTNWKGKHHGGRGKNRVVTLVTKHEKGSDRPSCFATCRSISFFKIFFIFIYSFPPGLSCSMWDLVHWQGIKPGSPALGAESQPLDHQGRSHLSPFKADHRKKVFIIWQLLRQMIQLQGSEWTRFRRQLSCCKTLSLLFIQLSVIGGSKSDRILQQILRLSSHLGVTDQFKREALVFQFLLRIGVNILS